MSALPGPTQSLSEQLEEVTLREARHRLKVAQEFLVLQTQLKAHRQRLDELNDELGRRNTYIHELHAARAGWEQSQQRLHEDIASFMHRLAATEDEARHLRDQVSRMRRSWGWTLMAPLRQLQRRLQKRTPPTDLAPFSTVPTGGFVYYLKTSPFRLYREPVFTLRGWAFPEDGRAITAIRVVLDDQQFMGKHGLAEPDVIAQHGPLPNNSAPGFEITFSTPSGRHLFSLDAQLDHREWRPILRTAIWGEPDRSAATS